MTRGTKFERHVTGSRKHILVILTDAYGGRGGIALYNRNVLRALCEHPSQPEVVALPRVATMEAGELPRGLRYVERATNSKLRFTGFFGGTLLQRPFDMVICSHLNLLPFAKLAAIRSRSKLALFAYGKEAWTPGKPLSNRLISSTDAIISIRDHTLERLRAWSGAEHVPSFLLENAFDLERYAVGSKRADLVARFGLRDKRVLLILARLDERDHGVDEVLNVMPALLREDSELRFLIAGSGRHEGRLREKAMQLGLGEHAIFTGEVPEADKADYYRLGDVFVMPGSHPTLFDTYPMRFSFLEAHACGLPVVAARPVDLDRYRVQLPNIYVDAKDPESIKDGIRSALRRSHFKRVPDELYHYSFGGFQSRLWDILQSLEGDIALAS